jgi:aspartate/methionine/tyrosine aminotransferase
MARFPRNDIMSLIGASPRYELAESYGPDLRLGDLFGDGDHSGASGQPGFGDIALGYGTAEGDPSLRRVIAEMHGVGPDEVVVTMGGVHALFLIAFILCGKGDEAVAASPLFPPARAALAAVGAELSTVRLLFEHGYRLDLADIDRLLSERTRLVSLASPQNPSGVAIRRETLRELLAVMERKCPQAYLLVDETYREAAFGDDAVAPSAVDLSAKVISVASLSKCHGAPGLRLGWAITRDPTLREQLVLGKFNTVISCSPVDEALALRVLQQRGPITEQRRRLFAAGLASTERWVAENAAFVDWVRPDAGSICCVRLKPAIFDDIAVSRFYDELGKEGVRVGNGLWFGEQARVFRLGFGFLPRADLEAALRGLSAALGRSARRAA